MSDPTPQPAPLTPLERFDAALAALPERRRRFVREYLHDLNGTRAAIRAGYGEKSARAEASRLLTNVDICTAVDAGLELYAMPAGEIVARLTRIARGSIADVLRLPPADYAAAAATMAVDGATPQPTAIDSWALDLVKAQQTGAIDLIKSMKTTEHGTAFEFYSAHEALRDLAKIRGLGGGNAPGAVLSVTPDQLAQMTDDELDELARKRRLL